MTVDDSGENVPSCGSCERKKMRQLDLAVVARIADGSFPTAPPKWPQTQIDLQRTPTLRGEV